MLGIYLHIPFCMKKCLYCDFVSVEDLTLMQAYLCALREEIRLVGGLHYRVADSVFLGGGTPSLLSGGDMARLLDALRTHFRLDDATEITVEANPGTLDAPKLRAYKGAGVNRLSLGMQAAQDGLLTALGRGHTAAMFDEAYGLARDAGFENINVDIMYALPGQGLADVERTMRHALKKGPEHISAYALHISEGTPFYAALQRGEIIAATQDEDAEQYHLICDMAKHELYHHYEISNFAREGFECRHNLKYWNLHDYVGLGVAAHSCTQNTRYANTADVGAYMQNIHSGKLQYASWEETDARGRKMEYLMLKLRQDRGFSLFDYRHIFGEDFSGAFGAELQAVQRLGLAEVKHGRVVPTQKGFDLQNVLVGELIRNI